MKAKIMILAATLALVSCGGNTRKKPAVDNAQKTAAAVPDMHNAENALDYRGTYRGTFPAADGPGIEVTLKLKPDGTYEQHLKYIDRKSEFDAEGGYAVTENLLTLTPSDGGVPEYYKVEENRLRRLDAEKQSVTGALADHYILTKQTDK